MTVSTSTELFVPGRICLLGEHSDWAGSHRTTNPSIQPGRALVAGTKQGIHATCRRIDDKKFRVTSTANDGTQQTFECDLSEDELLSHTKSESYFAYTTGAAYVVLQKYKADIGGIEIDNNKTDLPIRKGLSSSAALCVLVVRAFNVLYNLKLSTEQEMDLAYHAERQTGSKCGRLDQCCAFGSNLVDVGFNGDDLTPTPICLPADTQMWLCIVDLNKSKDTKRILHDLNSAYPTAETKLQRNVQLMLGTINEQIVQLARDVIELKQDVAVRLAKLQQQLHDKQQSAKSDSSDEHKTNGCSAADNIINQPKSVSAQLGQLMTLAQGYFDLLCAPACPSELTAPALHRCLSYPAIQPLIHGGKWVGSGGDGSAQLIARSQQDAKQVKTLLEKELQVAVMLLSFDGQSSEP